MPVPKCVTEALMHLLQDASLARHHDANEALQDRMQGIREDLYEHYVLGI